MSLGYLYTPDGGVIMSKERFFSVTVILVLVFGGLSGCFLSFTHEGSSVLSVTTTSKVRAKFVVIDEISSVAVAKGLTPDTVALSGAKGNYVKAKYRVEITHPDTGEVYSVRVEGELNLLGKAVGIDTTKIRAPF